MSKISITGIVPAAYRDAGNRFAAAMGWQPEDADPGTFNMPVTADGKSITHWGFRAQGEKGGEFEQAMASPPPEAAPLLAVMVVDVSDTLTGADHFDAVLAANGMRRWDEPA